MLYDDEMLSRPAVRIKCGYAWSPLCLSQPLHEQGRANYLSIMPLI